MAKVENGYTIAESYTLPSRGLCYNPPINPDITLRSMTIQEEMKRLTSSETPYKVMCGIIEDCIVGDKPGISVYDMCLGDYQFLLHKLRTVTYGSEYKMQVKCPVCGGISEVTCNLDELEVVPYDDSIKEMGTVHLPVCEKTIELKFQTPRILDEISKRKKEILQKSPEMLVDPGFLLTVQSMIKTVDGQTLNPAALENFVRKMQMRDANLLMQKAVQFNESVGLNTDFTSKCKHCEAEMLTTFRITSEFFGPTVD